MAERSTTIKRRLMGLLPAHARTAIGASRTHLLKLGAYQTMQLGRPVKPDGSPIPWYTYPAIAYLEQLDLQGLELFEYGSGHSTLFWQERVGRVVSVEHDRAWSDEMRSQVSSRVEYRLVEDVAIYADAIGADQFDVIVVDGIARPACVSRSVEALRPGGFIILDNSDRHAAEAALLRDRGLVQIDFHGLGPINAYQWTTSLFLHPSFRPRPLGAMPSPPVGGESV